MKKSILSIIALLCLSAFSAFGQSKKVYVLELHDEIHPASARYMTHGLEAAKAAHADLVLIHMNTYGGMVEFADTIRLRLLDFTIPTVVLIDKNAASAGALISLACDSIFMTPGSAIGAATVVNGADGQAMPDKYQSYMRGVMRSTAEKHGRNPAIAEKMVEQNLEIEGLSPKGTVITFTPSEALQHGFAEGIFDSKEAVIKHMGYEGAEVITHTNTWLENLIQFLINPAVSGILVMLIFGGLFMELKTPGFGFPGIVALVSAIIFFAPHYLEGLAESWEILIFIVGLILLALEIFVIPGFGVAGISGIVLTVAGLAIALLRNDALDFSLVRLNDALRSFTIVMVAMATSIVAVVWLAKYLVTDNRAFPFVDNSTQDKEKGYTSVKSKLFDLIGREGITVTELKPAGFIEIDGERLDAESEGVWIDKGIQVKVTSVKNISLRVKRI